MTVQDAIETRKSPTAVVEVRRGERLVRGAGFEALSFTHRRFDGLMDPLIMVDHFTMTEPTFGPHAHAGLSAVSVLFEDSVGAFRNRDSLGVNVELAPGDLYWLKAARGAVHDEAPAPGSRTHALQVFVNLPAARKLEAPASRHVRAPEMPVIEGPGHRVRVMTGESGGVVGAQPPAPPFTILDIALQPGGGFVHRPEPGDAAWLHAIRGEIEVDLDGTRQAVFLAGAPLREPFAMSDAEQLAAVIEAHAAGELGTLD